MPSPGETITFSDCPCCGSSSSSSHSSPSSSGGGLSCPGCPSPGSGPVTFTITSGTLFPGGFTTRVLTYDAGGDSWRMTYSFFGTVLLTFVCRSVSCQIVAAVAVPGCSSVASSFTPFSGMHMTLTGPGCPTYEVDVTW